MSTFGIQHKSIQNTLSSHWIDIVICVVVWAGAALCHWVLGPSPNDRFFLEGDPSLSYPYEKGWSHGEEVPTALVIVLAIPVAMAILLGIQLIAKKLFEYSTLRKKKFHPKALNFFTLQLAFLEAMGMTVLATEFIKPFAGRKRPNFFALCDYKGYRQAVTDRNFTAYNSLITPGAVGDLQHCRASIEDIHESQYSFPSGHSSVIWCGMTFVSLYLLYVMHRYSPKNNMFKGFLLLFFISSAVIVSVTRPRDYWHNFDDILAGSAIGFACAALSFALNYSPVLTSLSKRESAFDMTESALLPDSHIEANFASQKLFDGETPGVYSSI